MTVTVARRPLVTFALCLAATILEGIDIQAIGAVAPRLTSEFGLSGGGIGLLFSTSLLGLFLGAAIGGRLSDRIGRKPVLVASVFFFGLFSVLTTLCWDLPSLATLRFLTGLGLGGAMPNLIALVSETVPERWRRPLTTIMWAGTPAGGILAAQLAAHSAEWSTVFPVGGIAPLLLVPFMVLFLPESPLYLAQRSRAPAERGPVRIGFALFGEGRLRTTLLLWATYFCTLLVLHLLLNWLPLLVVGQGFAAGDAGTAAAVFNFGGCAGAVLLGLLLGVVPTQRLLVVTYCGMAAGLVGLAMAGHDLRVLLLSAGIAGTFVIGGQFMLYGLVSDFYPTSVRGTGVGATIAFGRLGSITGPAVVGLALGMGLSIDQLLLGLLPVVLVAATSALLLLPRRPSGHAMMARD